ncbi:MAG TPA: imidazolonepropionase [Candidatus Kapabacteria bacterium]|nr:imidazolonepropionase [Candidatus Kapabacteria bacterium]
MEKILFVNISSLVTVDSKGKGFKAGAEMNDVNEIKNGAIYFDNKILWYGTTDEARILLSNNKIKPMQIIDKSGFTIMPGFVDSHTHIVFAGDRAAEFGQRLRGATYKEIAEQGGGIQTTVKSTRSATKEELFENAQTLLNSSLSYGTTTIEIKSGYSLNTEGELKQLEVIQELRDKNKQTIVSTFMGAHDFPQEYKDNPNEYVDILCNAMLPIVKEKELATFCDIFIDEGYYTVEQAKKILKKAKELGFKLKVHADELVDKSAGQFAAEIGAISADHLLFVNDNSLHTMKASNTVACLLPGTAYFIRMPYANARKMIDLGLTVAIATDTNPGSSFTENMQLILSLAVINMQMSAEEAICAATLNGAKAIDLQDSKGSLEIGKDADFIILNTSNYLNLFYHFGINHVNDVWIGGKTALNKD